MSTLRKIRAVLIDLSGTLHVDDCPISGAIEALQKLRKSNFRIKFVTNTTKESKRLLFDRLTQMGFDVKLDEMFTSLTAARHLVDKMGIRPLLLLADDAIEDFHGISTNEPNAVVVGLAPAHFNYDRLNSAFQLVMSGAPLIAINKSRYYQRKDGLALATGPFVAALEYATDRKAKVVGKPDPAFFLAALESLNCLASEAIMIGDDVRDDVLGAQSAGTIGMLVKTGKYRDGDETRTDSEPNYVFKDFSEAVDFILNTF